ncbi:IspD/TarI family cytidylyltransferase [Candidatus Frankia alpina]|uniref:IspD/TarI family cytidylyltransferase n=1 Tax=Candidatus Frankia alpina TaxID=2699483 RepID=UPI001F1E97D7|nr:2-C-methyl-D-erythritol 4-phosphate cytidylyltransferase [Candidatus Frankia alpina]
MADLAGGPGRSTRRPDRSDVAGPVWTIVLAGGGGTRFGGPKQFFDLGGEPLLAHPVAAARAASDGIVVVVPAATVDGWAPPPGVRLTTGGATRAESVRAGLAAVPVDAGIIVITDAAHPLATPALYRCVVDEIRAGADAAVPGLPLTEVVKEIRVAGGIQAAGEIKPTGGVGPSPRLVAGASLPRETHRLVQTPHAFRADLLRAAHAGAREAVEDSAMVAEAGGLVVVVPGEPANIHVTTPDELAMARLLLTHVRSEGESDEFGTGRVHAVR